MPRNSTSLQNFIETNELRAKILLLSEPTPTVTDAARVLEVETDQIIKSLVFTTPSDPILAVINGLARIDRKKIADHIGIGKSRIKLARPEEALSISGFKVGSMPPFGDCRQLRTLVDMRVMAQAMIYGGGGDIDAMMRLDPAELIRITAAETTALAQ